MVGWIAPDTNDPLELLVNRTCRAILAGATLALMPLSPALAHGEVQSTRPARNAHVLRPPNSVTVTLTEAPTNEARLTVHDGCGNPVASSVAVRGAALVARTPEAQPGAWHVVFKAVSSVDGHLSKGSFGFHVGGRRDCTPGGGGAGEGGGTNAGAGGDAESPGAASPTQDTGSNLPVGPMVLAGAGIIVLAVVARVASSR